MRLGKTSLIIALMLTTLFAGGVTAGAGGAPSGGWHGANWGGWHGGSWGGWHGGNWGGWHGNSFGVVIGVPFWGPGYYPYYYPYYPYYDPYPYPYAGAGQSQPQAYIERPAQSTQRSQPSTPSGLWYFCPGSKTYYPYVKECPGGWNTVIPRPSSEQDK